MRSVVVWSTDSKVVLGRLRMQAAGVTQVAFDSTGGRLVVGGDDGQLRLWTLGAGAPVLLGPYADPLQRSNVPLFVSFVDGGHAVLAVLRGGAVVKWAGASGAEGHLVARVPQTDGYQREISPDGRHLVIFSGRQGAVIPLDGSGEPTRLYGDPKSLALFGGRFTPDGAGIVAKDGRRLWYWDWRRDQQGVPLSGHAAEVAGYVFSPDGRRLFSAGVDGEVRSWVTPSVNALRRYLRTTARHCLTAQERTIHLAESRAAAVEGVRACRERLGLYALEP